MTKETVNTDEKDADAPNYEKDNYDYQDELNSWCAKNGIYKASNGKWYLLNSDSEDYDRFL